jgi:hypothetical protein
MLLGQVGQVPSLVVGLILGPLVLTPVKSLCEVVALRTEGFRREALKGVAGPFATGGLNSTLTACTPSIWSRIIRTCSRPKESKPLTLDQSFDDMLTD